MSSGNLTSPLMQPAPHHAAQLPAPSHADVANREVEVWVRDVNGMRYGVNMPVSSRFADVMQKVREQNGPVPGVVVGFEGGSKASVWNERTTVSAMLPRERPANYDEADYLYEHPIQPKFKKECIIL